MEKFGCERLKISRDFLIIVLCLTTFAWNTCGQTTEGKKFALVFPYRGYDGGNLTTDVMFSARDINTLVRVTGPQGYDMAFVVHAYDTYIHVIHEEWYVNNTTGVEDKVLYAESDEPVRVTYSRTQLWSSANPDASIVYPVPSGEGGRFEYIISGNYFTYTDSLGSYFMLAAYEDDTHVQILPEGELDEENPPYVMNITLHKYEVYTTFLGPYDDIIWIVADKPLSVYCGHHMSRIDHSYGSSTYRQYHHEAMPPVENLNTSYLTVPIAYGIPEPGYVIRVVALEDETFVQIPEMNILTIIDRAERFDYDGQHILPANRSVQVFCSSICQVIQYTKQVEQPAPGLRQMAEVMMVLTPQSLYTDSLIFSPPHLVTQFYVDARLAITVSTRQVEDLWLNSENLADHPDWSVPEDEELEFSYLTLPIEWGSYHLYTSDNSSHFAAYIYAVEYSYRGVGLNLGYGGEYPEITTTTTTPTTTISAPTDLTTATGTKPPTTLKPEEIPFPTYNLILGGVFESSDGSEFPLKCFTDYHEELKDVAERQASEVNEAIGDWLCLSLARGDVELEVRNANLFLGTTEGATTIIYSMLVAGHVVLAEVHPCVTEVMLYLEDHANWDPPTIFPPIPECPDAVFDPPIFQDGSDEGENWDCGMANINDEEYHSPPDVTGFALTETPSYFFELQDSFTASDSLDVFCMNDYSQEWETAFTEMITDVKRMMDEDELCEEQGERVMLDGGQRNFGGQGTQGYIEGTFMFNSNSENEATFDDITSCGHEVYQYVRFHSSWDDPILTPPEDCPVLMFGPEGIFKKDKEGWDC